MIIGSCPYDGCEGKVFEAIADLPLPKFHKHVCETCKRVIWTKHSRIDPCSWTEEDFHKNFIVDEVAKKIEPRNPTEDIFGMQSSADVQEAKNRHLSGARDALKQNVKIAATKGKRFM